MDIIVQMPDYECAAIKENRLCQDIMTLTRPSLHRRLLSACDIHVSSLDYSILMEWIFSDSQGECTLLQPKHHFFSCCFFFIFFSSKSCGIWATPGMKYTTVVRSCEKWRPSQAMQRATQRALWKPVELFELPPAGESALRKEQTIGCSGSSGTTRVTAQIKIMVFAHIAQVNEAGCRR